MDKSATLNSPRSRGGSSELLAISESGEFGPTSSKRLGSIDMGTPSNFRTSTLQPRMPMPSHIDLEKRFTQVLVSMDLPPDKAKLLKNYDDDKKWDMICDQEKVIAKDPPDFYLDKLRTYLDPTAAKSSKSSNLKRSGTLGASFRRVMQNFSKRRMLGDTTSTQLLRDLEISLRTNSIQWVLDFLNTSQNGLEVLVQYLQHRINKMRQLLLDEETENAENTSSTLANGSRLQRGGVGLKKSKSKMVKSRSDSFKLNMGDATDDVHICIMCLRAIMNNKTGFNLVFAHKQAVNCIALGLKHKSPRTRALVLELLAAVCLVSGGHAIVMAAFENFKQVCGEQHRFETLMLYFTSQDDFHIDFMVACMQFINIVVHSVENMNFRVHLQYEFSMLDLDSYLTGLKHLESERLAVQVTAYLDNLIDVAQLLEDSDAKNLAIERVAELQDDLSFLTERVQEAEDEANAKVAEAEAQVHELEVQITQLKEACDKQKAELDSLNATMDSRLKEASSREQQLTGQLDELRRTSTSSASGASVASPTPIATSTPTPPPPPPPPAAPAPPPPPPPIGMAPPAPPLGAAPPLPGSMTIKRKIQPRHRLPALNWVAMKPQDVRGTVFSDLDDEKLYNVIDFAKFEDIFKLGTAIVGEDTIDSRTPKSERKQARKVETVSLLDANRLKTVAITKKKLQMTDDEIVKAINSFDLKTLSLESVEILTRMLPNEQEVKLLKDYEKDRKPIEVLADEDKFMLNLMRVERLPQKMQVMMFMGNFFDTYHNLLPQLSAVIAASDSIKASQKIRKLLEIILAFGNYMNSAKRGAAYGFRLQSLDMLLDAKSPDKKMSLMHFIVITIREKFPDIKNFENDLRHIEKASTVLLDNVLQDIRELEKGMEMTKREVEARKPKDVPLILQDFINNSEDKLKKLKTESTKAQDVYNTVVEYFGENPKTLAPNLFFSIFARFANAYKQAEEELEVMKKMQEAQTMPRLSTIRERKTNPKEQKQDQAAVMFELKNKQYQVRDKKVMNREDVYHGALEDILSNLKTEPYRRADGMRRSQRRHVALDIGKGEGSSA